MLFDLKTMEESHQKVAPAEILKFEDIDELPEAPEEREGTNEPAEKSGLNFGSDPLNVTDLAFKEFAARKETILANVNDLTSARQDLDASTKQAVILQVEKALN